MSAQVGMRVLRGPDWSSGDEDGGEGHLGTVISLLDGHRVRVLWDHGKENAYRSGQDDKFDLRVFDSAPVGVRHQDTVCAACDEKQIYGMLWRCKNCRSCSLCALCYVMDKHDIKHEFLRYTQPGSSGEPMKKRSVSLKIRAMGIFPGAKVKRGKDWAWADQDGGLGTIGEVTGFENVAPDSSRNIVRVQWPHGKTNSYRLGFQGNVDLMCVEEEAGTYYYRDHLPVLSTKGGPPSSSPPQPTASGDNSAIFKSSSSTSSSNITSTPTGGGGGGGGGGEEEEMEAVEVGNKVTIHVDEEKLKELQLTCGGCTATMLRCIGKTGEVQTFAPNGTVAVKFDKISYRLHPQSIMKVPALKVGDMVRIRNNLEKVKLLNKRIGWKSGMDETIGKVGQVTKIDSDGDVVVSFGRVACMFAPVCCIPVSAATSFDSLTSSTTSVDTGSERSSESSSSSSGGNDDYGDLHQNLMRFIAQMAGVDLRRAAGLAGLAGHRGGSSDDNDTVSQLFKAITKGDVPTVRALCQQDKTLANKVRQGLTPLIVAAHEAKKDVCSCLLALGADINGKGEKDNTPLGAALEGKKEDIALYLLEKGADPNVRNSKQRTPLHLAAYHNLPEAAKVIFQRGGDPNAKDQFGDTPLHDAIDQHNDEAVGILCRVKTIDLQAKNKDGFNMLQRACLKDHPHAVACILARDAGQVDKLLDGRFAALHIAANNDHVECIKLLVKNGNAQVSLQGHKNYTPLHLACQSGYVRSTEALLDLGAEVNAQNDDGNTPLHLVLGAKVDNPGAASGQNELRNRIRIACILMVKGAYPDLCNKQGKDPLETCVYSGVGDAVKRFMKENASVIKRCGSSGARPGTARGGLGGLGGLGGAGIGLSTLLQGMILPCGAPTCIRMSDITLMPCGHKALCRNCCLSISECPVCHQTIERRVHKRSDTGAEELAEACRQM